MILQTIFRYWKFWLLIAQNSMQEAFVNRATNILFILGKCIRLVFSLLFLLAIKNQLQFFGGYTTNQLLIFFLTYQLIDVIAQALFRGVYNFAYIIRRGEFDFALLKPINPLFQSLMGNPDINDVLFLIPTFATVFFLIHQAAVNFTFFNILLYIILLINGLLIATALHITILVFGIITMEVDGLTWLYRDFLYLGQLPVDVYKQPIRSLLSFIIPVGIMITIPARQLLGLSNVSNIIIASATGISIFIFSLKLWNVALKKYSSASS